MEVSHIIPDDIRNIDDLQIPEQIRAIYDYIKNMREAIDFWASRRNMDMQGLDTGVEKVNAYLEALEKSRAIAGFKNGDILETTLYGYGYATGNSGQFYFQFVLPYPVTADSVTIESGSNLNVRGVSGRVYSGSTIGDLGITSCVPNQSGFRIACSGLTTNWVSQTPASIVGTFRIKFLEGD